MKRILFPGFAAVAALATLLPQITHADAVITLSNKRIDGTITAITDENVTIRTENYGELIFPKLKLKEIIRGDAPSETSRKNNPFYKKEEPTQGGASFDIFGNYSSSGASSWTDTSQDFGYSVEINPNTGTSVPTFNAPAPEVFPEPGPRREVTPPEVPFSWDAVMFEVAEDCDGKVVVQPGTPPVPVANELSLRNGAELATNECLARVVMKNGADIIRVAPHTSIRLITSTPELVEIEIGKGTVWAQVAPEQPGRIFTIRTGNATITCREGVIRITDALDQGYHIAVLEGSAHIESKKSQIVADIPGGNMVAISPAGVLTPNLEVSRIIRHEDSNFDTLGAEWWLRADRLGIPREHQTQKLVSMNELRDHIREVGKAFTRFAEDTGHIPSTEEAFSVLRENRGNWPGWQGPYLSESLPPLDSWSRPMRYVTRTTGSGQTVGIVYSTGEDNIDNLGDPSADIPEMLLYYQLEGLAKN